MLNIIKNHAQRILCNSELIQEDITYDTLFTAYNMPDMDIKDIAECMVMMVGIILAHPNDVPDRLKILCNSVIIKCAPFIFGDDWEHGPICDIAYEFIGNKALVFEVFRNDKHEDGYVTSTPEYDVSPADLPENERLYGDNWQMILNRMKGLPPPPSRNVPIDENNITN